MAVTTLEQFAARADRADLATVPLTPFFDRASIALQAAAKENFVNQAFPDGTPWKPIGGFRVRGGSQALRDRGLLMASVTGNAQGSVRRVSEFELVQGTNLPYAATHQHGADIVPRSGRALAIPVSIEAYRHGGGPRRPVPFPKPLFMRWPRDRSYGGLFESKTDKRGKAKLVLHYLLVAKVHIEARPFIGFNATIVGKLDVILTDYLDGQVRRMA